VNASDVTLVVVPRERFSYTRDSLEGIYRHTRQPFALVYVDGGSPAPICDWLAEQATRRGFTLLRRDHYLSPNEARNIGFPLVQTKYVVFIDNDVAVSPGWLPPLLRCAEETGAGVVGPLYCIDRPLHRKVHMAGGLAHFEEARGTRRFIERHLYSWQWLADVRPQVARSTTGHAEFHCMLVRTDLMRRLGPLDEELLAVTETQIDLCLQARDLGAEVWFEPDSVVTYVRPPPFAWDDLPYYLLRWNDEWAQRGLERFRTKWNLESDDPFLERRRRWIASHRLRVVKPLWNLLAALGDDRRYRWAPAISRALDKVAGPLLTRVPAIRAAVPR
jgi:GT2 family glycosyltransferase